MANVPPTKPAAYHASRGPKSGWRLNLRESCAIHGAANTMKSATLRSDIGVRLCCEGTAPVSVTKVLRRLFPPDDTNRRLDAEHRRDAGHAGPHPGHTGA